MTETGYRSNLELAKEVVEYLNGRRGVVTQSQLCSAVGINSKTAKMWLKIFHLIKNQCPHFQLGKAGRSRIISVYGVNEIGGDSAGALRRIAEKGVTPAELEAELTEKLNEGIVGLEPVAVRSTDVPRLFPILPGTQVRCPDCGATKEIPSSLRESKEWEGGSPPGGELEVFLGCDQCGGRMQRVVEANPMLSPVLKAKLKCAACGETLELSDSLGEGETIIVPIHCNRPMRVIITKE